MRRRLAALSLTLATSACISAPSPLNPALRGSVGVPHAGVLTEASELPKSGTGFTRFRQHSPNYFGGEKLVSALERVSEKLAQSDPNGAPIVVGDLSAAYGGKIPGHNSHRTGRDVDLLFFYRTSRGAVVTAPGFIHVESDGLARVSETGELLLFDVERQWRLFRALLEEPELGVQFLFVSHTIEALVIDYARARGEPLELIYRAQSVMLEPKDSTPHDDHVHVRVACSPEETFTGCSGGGPYWEWLDPLPLPSELDSATLSWAAQDEPLEPLTPLEQNAILSERSPGAAAGSARGNE
jgi:penicillin-insensitive murein endopeptidase